MKDPLDVSTCHLSMNRSGLLTLTRSMRLDDGDVSSATGPSRSSLTSLPRHPLASTSQQDPIKARPLTSAFNALAVTQQPISSANSSAPSSPHHSPIASRHPGHAGLGAPPAWAAAPQGFLSSLTPNEIQVSRRHAARGRLRSSFLGTLC